MYGVVCSQEEICEGQIELILGFPLISSFEPNIKVVLPKSLRYLGIPIDGIDVASSVIKGRTVWHPLFNERDIINFPIGLLHFNGIDTPYALALPHISQAMLAMHKICTVNGYGKGVAMTIMRAMYETGAIMADEWNLIDSKKKLKHV